MKSDIGRYAIVPEWLLETVTNGTAIRLFAVLACKYADRQGVAYPSRRTLGKDLGGASKPTVDRAVAALVDVGALTVEAQFKSRKERRTNRYTLTFSRPPGNVSVATPDNADVVDPGLKNVTENQTQLEPEGNGTRPIELDTPCSPPQAGELVAARAKRAKNGSRRKRDQEALKVQQATQSPEDRYLGPAYQAAVAAQRARSP